MSFRESTNFVIAKASDKWLFGRPSSSLVVIPMTKKKTILDELHAVREQLLVDSGSTLVGLVVRVPAERKAFGRKVLETRRTKWSTGAANSGELEGENLSSLAGDL